MGCGSSSSPTAAEAPVSVDPITVTTASQSNLPVNVIAAVVPVRSSVADTVRTVSIPLTKPPSYQHPTPITMVSQQMIVSQFL